MIPQKNNTNVLELDKSLQLIAALGGPTKIARQLGLTQPAVTTWRRRGVPGIRLRQLYLLNKNHPIMRALDIPGELKESETALPPLDDSASAFENHTLASVDKFDLELQDSELSQLKIKVQQLKNALPHCIDAFVKSQLEIELSVAQAELEERIRHTDAQYESLNLPVFFPRVGERKDDFLIPTVLVAAMVFQPLNRNAERVEYKDKAMGTFSVGPYLAEVKLQGAFLNMEECHVWLLALRFLYQHQNSFDEWIDLSAWKLLKQLGYKNPSPEHYQRLWKMLERMRKTFLTVKFHKVQPYRYPRLMDIGLLPFMNVRWVQNGKDISTRCYQVKVSSDWLRIMMQGPNEYRILPSQWADLSPMSRALELLIANSSGKVQKTFTLAWLKNRVGYKGRASDFFRAIVKCATELEQKGFISQQKLIGQERLKIWQNEAAETDAKRSD